MLLSRLEEEKFWSRTDGLAQIYDPTSGEPRNITWGEVFRVALMLENKVTLLAMFCFFLAIVVWAFWAYHIWLTATNMTTNEAIKRGRVRARIQSAYEDEDEMVLDELKAMARDVYDSSDDEPVADSAVKKRPGKGAKGGKGKDPKKSSASAARGPRFGIRKLPEELGFMERFEDMIMRVPFMLRVVSGLFIGTAVGGYVGYVFLEWNFVWGGLVAAVTGVIAAAAVGGIPMLLGWGRPHIHMPNPYDRGLIGAPALTYSCAQTSVTSRQPTLVCNLTLTRSWLRARALKLWCLIVGNFGEVIFPRSERADAEVVADAPTEMKIVPAAVVLRQAEATAPAADGGKEQ